MAKWQRRNVAAGNDPTDVNPFLDEMRDPAPDELDHDPLLGAAVEITGPPVPAGRPLPADAPRIPHVVVEEDPSVWVLPMHGGCGASTVCRLLDDHKPTDGAASAGLIAREQRGGWPQHRDAAKRARVVLVARTHARGLAQLLVALRQWGAAECPGVDLLGVVLVADGPRPARSLTGRLATVRSLSPRLWHIGWAEAWRGLEAPGRGDASPRVRATTAGIRRAMRKAREVEMRAETARDAESSRDDTSDHNPDDIASSGSRARAL